MSNGEVCCILGVCCPPGSDAQHEALVHEIQKQRPGMPIEQATAAATRILERLDHFRAVSSILDEHPA